MTSPPWIFRSLSLLWILLGSLALAACQSSPSQPPEPPPEPPVETQSAPQATAATETQPATGESGASPSPSPPAASPTRPPESVGTTPDERIQALERELQASYGEHDAMLGEHQARTRAEAAAIAAQRGPATPAAEPDQGGLYEGLPGFGPAPAPPDTGEGMPTETANGSAVGGQTTRPSVATGGQPGGGRVPADIPDGRDDDIVARQLREAAQMEKDPALREKLWDEYRKYKNQQATP